jgi:hypothetical protein
VEELSWNYHIHVTNKRLNRSEHDETEESASATMQRALQALPLARITTLYAEQVAVALWMYVNQQLAALTHQP